MYEFDERLFWQKVKRTSDCFIWIAYRNPRGYGNFGARENGKHRSVLAHRIAWQTANGEIPAGLDVLHRCDNPACVRPEHLFVGIHADNMADMKAKGRYRNGMLGKRHWHTRRGFKISREIAEEIRSSSEKQADLGRKFGIHQSMVSKIKAGIHWPLDAPKR